jgi:hypothetical protein
VEAQSLNKTNEDDFLATITTKDNKDLRQKAFARLREIEW